MCCKLVVIEFMYKPQFTLIAHLITAELLKDAINFRGQSGKGVRRRQLLLSLCQWDLQHGGQR